MTSHRARFCLTARAVLVSVGFVDSYCPPSPNAANVRVAVLSEGDRSVNGPVVSAVPLSVTLY